MPSIKFVRCCVAALGVTLLLASAPAALAQAVSLLRNGSFEGTTRYWHHVGEIQLRSPGAVHGDYALEIRRGTIQSAAFALRPGSTVTLAFSARADKPTTIGWQFVPCDRVLAARYGLYEGMKTRHPIKLETEWKRYTFTFVPNLPQTEVWPRPTYMLQFGEAAAPWLLDAVSVSYEPSTETYVSSADVEVALESPDLKGYTDPSANLLEKGQSVKLVALALNPRSTARQTTLRWQAFDYEGVRPLGEPIEKTVTIPPCKAIREEVTMKLPAAGLVLVRCSAVANRQVIHFSDLPLSSLPYPKAATRPDPRERFGGAVFGPQQARQLQKVGMGWTRGYPKLSWADHQPKKAAEWKWFDAEIDQLAALGVSCHATLYSKPSWAFASPGDLLPSDMRWSADDPRWQDLRPQCDWDRFVVGMVERYRGKSLLYEIANEPEFAGWEEIKPATKAKTPLTSKKPAIDPDFGRNLYAVFAIRTARLIKATDPQAKVAANNARAIPSALNRRLLQVGGKNVDAITWHNYCEGWFADATSMRRTKEQLQDLGCENLAIWFNDGWTFTNTAADEPAVALTDFNAAENANALVASVAEATALGQEKTIIGPIGYETYGMSYWDYSAAGTMLWDVYGFPLPLVPAWNVLCHHLGLSEPVAFIRPEGANLCVFNDLRNKRPVIVAYCDRRSNRDVSITLPVNGLISEDIMGNARPLAGARLVLAKSGRPVFLYPTEATAAKDLATKLQPLDRRNAKFIDVESRTYRLPQAWEGKTPDKADGNPLVFNEKPIWRLDQIWPDDPQIIRNYTPLIWTGAVWQPAANSYGGQPEVRIDNGNFIASIRGASTGKPGQRIAALVFIPPKPGTYSVSAQVSTKPSAGKEKTFKMAVLRKDPKRIAPVKILEIPRDGSRVTLELTTELAAGHELVFLPLAVAANNATVTSIENLLIKEGN